VKEFLLGLAGLVSDRVTAADSWLERRQIRGHSPGGDAQFTLDDLAEAAVRDYIADSGQSIALFSEDHGLRMFGQSPEYLLIVDPIDGTRPAVAGLEMATISVAAARFTERPCIGDVEFALLRELRSGAYLYADRAKDGVEASGYHHGVPALSDNTDLSRMFWSIEFNGHPAERMTRAYGHLIDRSANTGAVFVFCSASFSISRVITGQLDAYADIGNRLLRDDPSLLADFERVGKGKVLHLFPYDIAASVLLAEKAGVVITDAYGRSLDTTVLTDVSVANQQSCIAACTEQLHRSLLEEIVW
jgi:myo-inositol-1(or 4)-monophosphatase